VVTIAEKRRASAERQARCRRKRADELATLRDAAERNSEATRRLDYLARQLRSVRQTVSSRRPAARGVLMKTDAGIALHALLTFVENQLDELSAVCDVSHVIGDVTADVTLCAGIDFRG
jgi:hypothetical protein